MREERRRERGREGGRERVGEGGQEGGNSLPPYYRSTTCHGHTLNLTQEGAAVGILSVRLCHNRSEVGTVVSEEQRIAVTFPRGFVKRQIDSSHFRWRQCLSVLALYHLCVAFRVSRFLKCTVPGDSRLRLAPRLPLEIVSSTTCVGDRITVTSPCSWSLTHQHTEHTLIHID